MIVPLPLNLAQNSDLSLEIHFTDHKFWIRLFSLSRQEFFPGLVSLKGFLLVRDMGGVTPRIVWHSTDHRPMGLVDLWDDSVDYDLYDTTKDAVIVEVRTRLKEVNFLDLVNTIPAEEWLDIETECGQAIEA
jgi:hypothetical protein